MGHDLSRRRALGAMVGGAAASMMPLLGHGEILPIPYHGGSISTPIPVPAVPVELSDGSKTDLARLLQGRATALNLMFTGCSTTCPIQGFVFSETQKLLRDPIPRGVQLLSLSINPLDDTPEQLRAWLGRFKAKPGWIAARPAPEGLDTLRRLFGSNAAGKNSLADHATEVSVINKRGNLIWRTYELPSPETLAEMLNTA
jgi:protein SCO1